MRKDESRPVTIVDTHPKMKLFVSELYDTGSVAVDMEFSQDTTRVLLMQFATTERIVLLDPLAGQDMSPVLTWLADSTQLKLTHSGHDDARLVSRQYGVEMRGVLDSQVCAAFCGFRYPISLAALLASTLQIEMSKSQQRSNWGARPLSEQQIRYAAADVLHLAELISLLSARLEGTPMLAWAHQESRRVVEERSGLSVPECAEWRFLDDYRFDPRNTLLALRLRDWSATAEIPRIGGKKRKIRPHDLQRIMAPLASDEPLTAKTRGLPDWLSESQLGELRGIRERGSTADEQDRLAALPPPGPVRRDRQELVSRVTEYIGVRCRETNISSDLVATKSAIEDLVRFGDRAKSVLTRGWRQELLGDSLPIA